MRAEPIGSLLASRGHITQEQLELALTEQKASGRPLGEIIVARGFAPGPTVAQALATQHGGLLKTEYGFATGWGGQDNSQARVAAPEPPKHDETAALRASLEEHRKALEAWKQAHAQLEERLAQANAAQAAPAADPRVAELEAEREALAGELDSLKVELAEARKPAPPVSDPRVATLEAEREALAGELDSLKVELAEARKPAPPVSDPRVATLEEERDALKVELAEARKPAPSGSDPRLSQLLADRETLQAELAARDASIEQLRTSFTSSEVQAEERANAAARELESARERMASLEAELATRDAAVAVLSGAPAGRWDGVESHLVFFQGADGYELVERSGPPPSEGSSVGTQIVARIASAPIPGSALPCAYLVA